MHDKIEKVKAYLHDVEQLKECMFDKTKAWFEGCDLGSIDAKEFGECIDVIKDLSEVGKYCWEALYFESIVKAMEESEDSEDPDRLGYDNWRYSSGRFAPRGRGTFYGYPMMHEIDRHSGLGDVHTGYGINGVPGHHEEMATGEARPSDYNEKYGKAYNAYRRSKRGYTQTGDEKKRTEMSEHAKEHFEETLGTFRDIWQDVPVEMKRKMKMELQTLIGEMNV